MNLISVSSFVAECVGVSLSPYLSSYGDEDTIE